MTSHSGVALVCIGSMYATISISFTISFPFKIENLRTLPDVGLILPCLTVILTDTKVLPTDDANCKDTIYSPSPRYMGSWPNEPSTINFVESGSKN